MDLLKPKKECLANLPTRVSELKQFNKQIPVQIFLKRDDDTGGVITGNKVRKLEYLLHAAKRKNSNTTHVITTGGIQSNHCRATALCARQLGLVPHLVLRMSPEMEEAREQGQEDWGKATIGVPDGNLFLLNMLDSDITWITKDEYTHERDSIMESIAGDVERQGGHAYVIPEGGSNAIGCWGYIEMVQELMDKNGNIPYEHIVLPIGSGGTLAGILLGLHMLNQDHVKVWAVNVCDDEQYFRNRVTAIIDEFNHHYGTKLEPGEYNIIDGYVGEGYAIPYPEQIATMKKMARLEGIILDPVYSGKAFHALIDQLELKNKNSVFQYEHNDKVLYCCKPNCCNLQTSCDRCLLSTFQYIQCQM
eukprot:TRINITY_DN3417_c0_g1_i8.p1 TRINITY_DN3417_c0_g1~~TRINITY_DN3417_c0_g1_i8.p1  ORF type:complete len:362 (+),score=69.31 TRINITY_DN3417_c0_g1_i8:221-1306(+)